MAIGAMLSRLSSAAYYAVWPLLRPGGYAGGLRAAYRRRNGRDWASSEEVWTAQRAKLNGLLAYAAREVPYYRRLAGQGALPDRVERPEDLAAMPILTKDIIRREGEAMLAEGFPRQQMRRNATGGSTGQPLGFWSDEPALLASNAGEAWALTLAGLRQSSPLAYFWGAGRLEPATGGNLKERLKQAITNRLFIDCFHMASDDLRAAHRRLSRFRPAGLVGYTSALVELARSLRREGLQPGYPRKAILSAAETLDGVSRQVLEETFGVPVYDRYGSREIGLIAMECGRHQGLHIDCENVFVELLDDPAAGRMQRIVVTKLNQYGMPFLRYDIGDYAEGPISQCPCGRGFPVLKRVVGRVTETIRMPDGSCLPGELFPHLFKDCGVASYRVEQSEDYSLAVSLVKLSEQTPEQDALLRRVIRRHVGPDVPISVRYVDRIERSATGKLLPVISRAPATPARAGEEAL